MFKVTPSKQKTALITIACVWILSAIMLFSATSAFAQNQNKGMDIYSQLSLFTEVLQKLKQYYVTDLNDEELIKAAIIGMLGNADPHTSYFTADEFTDFTTSTKGAFGGLGIQIDKNGDYVTVVSPIEGTPAYRMGISAGDKIIKVDGKSVVGFSTDEAIKLMRGDVGTQVIITISRPGIAEPMDFNITREIIKIKSVPYFFKLDNGVGYIRITQFNENTAQELRESLTSLESENIRGLILDLRSNPGGLLDQAVDTVNEFIGKDKLVVETKGRIPSSNRQHFTRFPTRVRNYPIVVLINEASASASEIFAGSLQDWDKALVLGKTSFGKGSVQQLFPLLNGNGIKVTTSYYYIKSGRCIHKMLNDKLLKGKEVSEAEKKEEEEKNHEQIYYTVNGRKMYGGGGITPDIEVQSDLLTNFGVELRRKNAFFNCTVNYFIDHDSKIPKDFSVSEALFSSFLTYVREQNISYTAADLDSTASFIRSTLKSEFMRKAYSENDAYKATIDQDKQLQAAIDLFDKYSTMQEMFDHAVKR